MIELVDVVYTIAILVVAAALGIAIGGYQGLLLSASILALWWAVVIGSYADGWG